MQMGRGIQRSVFAAAVIGLSATAGFSGAAYGVDSHTPHQVVTAPVRSQPTPAEIPALFNEWNGALATLDPNRVADRYAPDGVLVPTLSDKVRTSRGEIVDYFEHFLEKRPQATIVESHVKVLSPTEAIDTGIYRFTLTEKGAQTIADARYTFVYALIDGTWYIQNHHSSAMPE